MSVRAVIAPGIIFAAGSIAGAANAATTINTNIAPSVEGTPITLVGGVNRLGAAQFVFADISSEDTFKAEIRATEDDLSAGIFYQGTSETLAAPTDDGFTNRSIKTADGSGAGNYALRFSANDTTYTGYATLVENGGLIDSVTYEAASAVPAVPEPSTWAMMILGMGVAGSELRRRRRQSRNVVLAA